jgi:two-component system OmpR family response regulator
LTAARIMHVDDEPDIREVVRISLELDPELTVRSCASGAEALAAVGEWAPDLVLLDVMMPNMDGPTTLAMLHQVPGTAAVPVVFMTARVQTRELDHFKSLGAAGVLAKPFDPGTLAEAVRKFLKPRPERLDDMQEEFLVRAREYAKELAGCVAALASGSDRADELVHVRQIAHRLAGSGGIFGYRLISADAAALEEVLIAEGADAEIQAAIDTLLARIFGTTGDQLEPPVGPSAFADPQRISQ